MKVASKPTAQKDPLANPGNQVGQPGERESVLLALSTALAGIRERKELFGTIIEKIRPVIPVDDTGLLVLDKTGRYWQDWTNVDNYQGHAASTQLKQMGYDGLLPVDRWMEYTLNHTGIMTVGKFKEQYPEHPFGPVMWEAGLREMMFAPLVHRGDRLGVLFFDSQQAGTYSETHLPLFQAVADLIAVAVANILANEEILEREREKATLLSISEQLATIRDKHDLFSVIFQKLRPVFRFDDAVVVLCDEQRQHTLHLHTATNPSAQHNDHYQFIISERVPVAGTPYEEFLFNDAPKIYSYQYLSGRYPHHVGVRILKDFGLLESVFMPLRYGGRVLGTLEFHATEQGRFAESQMPLFSNVADQVAVAVANILADEEILEREREKSVLLSISEAVATIRDKQDLLKVVFEKVQPLFSFYDTGFFVLDPQGEYIEDWSVTFREVSPSAANLQLQASGAGKIRYAGSAIEWAIGRLKAAAGPQIFPYNDAIFSQYPDYPQFEVLKRIGYQESLAALLRTDGREMGLLFFNSLTADHFQASQFTLFQAVADQLAVAVANILANEEILQREREKALLLSLSEDMATIRDRNNLWRVMMEKVKTLVQFDDAVVGVYTNEGKTCNHLLTVSPPERMSNPHYQHIVNQDIPVDGPIAYLMSKPKYYAFPLHELLEQWPAHPGLLLMAQTGLRYTHHMKLNWAGKTLGFVHFHFDSTARPAQNQQNLLIAIADQVAVAVANILANEEILEREREKALLLSLSEDMATIRDRADLWRVMMEKAKLLLPFDESPQVCVLDPEGKQMRFLLIDPSKEAVQTKEYQENVPAWFPVANTPFAEALNAVTPTVFTYSFFQQHYPDYWGTRIWQQVGIQEMLAVQLSYAGKVIGIFNILSRETGAFSPRFFSLFKAIADQVAVAVANILANEEILEREREKATLLSISEQLATIRDKHDLFTVIFEQLRPVFNFDDAVVVLYDAQSASTRHFTHIHSAAIDRTTAPTYQRIMTDKIPLAGTPYQEMLQLEEPRIVQMEYLLQHYQDHIGVQAAKAFGLTQHVFMPLRYCGQLLGFLEFHAKAKDRFNPHQLPLFRNVADQVAVAVANILANEEILQQKAEIEAREREKSLQVALINALTEPGNWEAKLLKAALVLQAHLPFDYLVIGLEEPDQAGRAYSFYRTGQREYQTIGREDFFRLTSLTPEKYAKLRQGKHYGQALVHNGADFESHCRQNGLQKIIAETFRLQSNLLFPLSLTRAGTFVLSFFSRQPQSYQAPHLALLEKLESTLSLTLDRLLAYEEIEGLSRQLRLDNRYLSEEIKSQYNFEEMVGGSRSMGQVFENLSLVAPTDTTVLILGETGTGKELIARALHNLSPRKGRPLIKVNCAALPANLIESELFGHEKGAFTGAIEQRIGKFELAQKGTIFLDEVGELPLELQSKLLRVLQEKEIERLGGKKTLSVDVRILAATNRKLEVEVKEGRFRADLYYRLNVFPLQLPPLRERREDIPLLAVHFAEKYARKMGKPLGNLSNASMQQMLAYNWPGNIRELEFLVERATILSRNGVLEIEVPVAPSAVAPTKVTLEDLRFKSLQESERDYIIEALKKTRGQVRGTGGAAELLQINPSTLVARIAKLGIKPKEVASGRSSY